MEGDGGGDTAAAVVLYGSTTEIDADKLMRAWRSELDESELARLSRFRFKRDRRDYLAAHVLLRKGRLEYSYEAPWSLTHTDGFAACAFAPVDASGIGVDAEPLASAQRLEKMTETFLGPRERSRLGRAPLLEGVRMVQLWTAKEATLKFLGTGIVESIGFGVLRSLECSLETAVDGWEIIGVRDKRSGERHTAFVRRLGEHVLAVVTSWGEQVPRLVRVDLR